MALGLIFGGCIILIYQKMKLQSKNYEILNKHSFVQNFCQGHTLNGSCAKRSSILDSKIGLLTLTDPRQHKKLRNSYETPEVSRKDFL